MKRSRGTREGREADQDFGAAAKGLEGDVYGSSKVRARLGVLSGSGSYWRPRRG